MCWILSIFATLVDKFGKSGVWLVRTFVIWNTVVFLSDKHLKSSSFLASFLSLIDVVLRVLKCSLLLSNLFLLFGFLFLWSLLLFLFILPFLKLWHLCLFHFVVFLVDELLTNVLIKTNTELDIKFTLLTLIIVIVTIAIILQCFLSVHVLWSLSTEATE